MADAQALLIYWPTAAAAGALLAVLLSLVWTVMCLPRIKAAIIAAGANRKDLVAARARAKVSMKGVKDRRGEMQAMNKAAGQLFWRTEKTWVG
ncbi:MAG TPA: hypothetical protein VFV70_05495 [Hyphomonadaceae bacterium]|nr:hypothetical protein [Hyphomonadaceae bacterium]